MSSRALETEKNDVSVLLIAVNPLFRDGIAELLTAEGSLRLVGDVTDFQSNDRIVRAVRTGDPDVVLMVLDHFVSGMEELIQRLLLERPGTRVVVLTDRSARTVQRLLALGVCACLRVNVGRQELIATISAVKADPDRVVISLPRSAVKWVDGGYGHILSERELEILSAAAAGASNSQIATRLYISVGTVKRHLSNIYAKLQVSSRTAAVNSAVRSGLIDQIDAPW